MQDSQTQTDTKKKPSYPGIMLRVCLFIILMTVSIFLLAGRLNYWQGWLLVATYLALLVAVFSLYSRNKDLIYERIRPGPGVKWWDKIFFVLYVPSALSVVLIAALDAGRLYWSPPLPVALYLLIFALMLLSYSLVFWAMWTNKFFSSRVRIQTDRGHYVITDGPYRFIRHPGYAGAVVLIPSMALILGSLYALIPAAVAVLLIIIRTCLEDRTLQRELPGYADYTKKTKFRLIPGVW